VEADKNAMKGKKGFQKVKSKKSNRVMVRFTDEEYKMIDDVLGDTPKASVIRSVFLEYITALSKNSIKNT